MEHEEVPILRSEHEHDIEMPVVSEGTDVLPTPSQLSCDSVCAFSKQATVTSESEQHSKPATKLCVLMIFSLIVMVVEIVGGVKAHSLAVMTDAAHLLTDVAGFSISLFSVWASGWQATSNQSFGFNRLEVLGALLSVQLIWLISGVLVFEAVNRILHKHPVVNGSLMFAIAAFGFVINLIMATWLGHDHAHHVFGGNNHSHDHDHHQDHDHEGKLHLCAKNEEETNLLSKSSLKTKILNINVQGAYLHVMADAIQSIGVMIAGAVIWVKPNWLVVDLICTFVFSAFALVTTLPMLRSIFGILMEGTPCGIDAAMLESGLKSIKGVQSTHDLHVWAITVGKIVLSCHVVAEPGVSSSEIVHRIREYCERTHQIHHVTIQIE